LRISARLPIDAAPHGSIRNGLGNSLQTVFLHYFSILNGWVMQRKLEQIIGFRDTETKQASGLDDIKVTQ
jgi:hypothetical protein